MQGHVGAEELQSGMQSRNLHEVISTLHLFSSSAVERIMVFQSGPVGCMRLPCTAGFMLQLLCVVWESVAEVM